MNSVSNKVRAAKGIHRVRRWIVYYIGRLLLGQYRKSIKESKYRLFREKTMPILFYCLNVFQPWYTLYIHIDVDVDVDVDVDILYESTSSSCPLLSLGILEFLNLIREMLVL